MVNVLEYLMLFSNLMIFLASPIALLKGIYLIAISCFLSTIFSIEYHACYEWIQIFSDRSFSFSTICVVDNIKYYGSTFMFADIFFATTLVYIILIFIMPTKKGMIYRYCVLLVGLLIIIFIGFLVGFFSFPDDIPGNIFKLLLSLNILNKEDSGDWNKTKELLISLSKVEKSLYISFFSFLYVLVMYSYHLHVFFNEAIEKKNNSKKFKNISQKSFYGRVLSRYYKKNFNVVFLCLGLFFGFVGIGFWMIIDVYNPPYYEYSHWFWHVCCGLCLISFTISLKYEKFYEKKKEEVLKKIILKH